MDTQEKLEELAKLKEKISQLLETNVRALVTKNPMTIELVNTKLGFIEQDMRELLDLWDEDDNSLQEDEEQISE